MNTTETDLIFERYTQTKILSENESADGDVELEEDYNDQYAPEDAPADDQFGGMEPEEDESLGDSSDFEDKAEKFADALGDDELKFLHTLRDDQFPILMDFIKDEVGYRNQTFAEGDEY